MKINEAQLRQIVYECALNTIDELKLPNYNFKDFERLLIANGYSYTRDGKGSHKIYNKPGSRPISVPYPHGGGGKLNPCLTAGIIKREGLKTDIQENIEEFEDEGIEPIEFDKFLDILENNGWHYFGYKTVSNKSGQTGVRYNLDKDRKDATAIEYVVKEIKTASKCPECIILSNGQNRYASEITHPSIILVDMSKSINEAADYVGADLDFDRVKEEAEQVIWKMHSKNMPISWKRVANVLNFQIHTLNDEDLETLRDAIEEAMFEADCE